MRIREIMNTCVAECTEDTPLASVYELIQACDHGFVVVLDSDIHRVPIGVVSEHSICEQLIGKGRKPKGLTAGNVMDSRIKRVSDAAAVEDCFGLLNGPDSEAILAVNEKREFAGVLSKQTLAACVPARRVSLNPEGTFQNMIGRKSPSNAEIPAFGWIQ